jgi:nucleoside 2-deoxyribosyltransferase
MKFYLASSFDLVERVKKVAEILRKHGHEITCEWWVRDYKDMIWMSDDEWYEHFKVQEISKRNFDAVSKADVLLLVAGDTPRKFNGANIELGYALALGKPCYSIGKLERSAMYVSVRRREFLDEVLGSEKEESK